MRTLRPVTTLLLLLLACPAFCQDYDAFVAGSDRSDNLLLLEMLRGEDLAAALRIAAALGRREDAFIGEILERLPADAAGADRARSARRQVVMRTLLASVFAGHHPDLPQRLRLNAYGLRELSGRLEALAPPLQREVLRLLALEPELAHAPALMCLGADLVQVLAAQRGRLQAEQAALLREYLGAVLALGDADFAPLVLQILEHTREPTVARAARSAAQALLPEDERP